jgi:hypothetical protein
MNLSYPGCAVHMNTNQPAQLYGLAVIHARREGMLVISYGFASCVLRLTIVMNTEYANWAYYPDREVAGPPVMESKRLRSMHTV